MSSTGDSTAADGACPVPAGSGRPASRRTSIPDERPVTAGGPAIGPAGSPTTSPTSGPAIGYRGPSACAAAGITYRQLDYWDRTGLVEPTVRAAQGSGTQRLYGFRDVLILRIVKRLLDAGVSLQNIRVAVHHLRSREDADLPSLTLMSDGATVYECSSPEDVVRLLQGGTGIFGIAVGVVRRDVEAALELLHAESVETGDSVLPVESPMDELARRRRNRVG